MGQSEREVIAYLQTPQAIRDRCQILFDLCCQDRLNHFACDLERLDTVADYAIATMREHYPHLDIPFHSRWRHFDAGEVPRLHQLAVQLAHLSPRDAVKAKLDLVVTSVLLDAGAGRDWQYCEPSSGKTIARSEGLAVASYHLFCQGAFSADPAWPFQVDAEGLLQLTEADLRAGFQVSDANPLVGIEGRLALLHSLGQALQQQPHRFGTAPARPGHLIDALTTGESETVSAASLLTEVLEGLGSIWPGRVELAGVNLGDVWPHSALTGEQPGEHLVPFHKLSQWLTYSLVEPLTEAGMTVSHLEALTGLAEYRNGGLCVDLGLLQPKHAAVLEQTHAPGSEVVVEWRSLTIVLLDRLAARIRQKLGLSADELPLMKVLEGGTWSAGRRIARQLRPDGSPPIAIASDGTVF